MVFIVLGRIIRLIRIVWYSGWFNFHYLPFHQAIKLPIFLWKPDLIKCEGKVVLEGEIYPGKIQLGFRRVSIYKDNGFVWENHGGTVIFKGTAIIGGGGAISGGTDSVVELGNDIVNNRGLKLVSYFGVKTASHTRFGWNTLIMDTNFHTLYDRETKKGFSVGGAIEIGEYNWFSTDCRIMHSVKTPARCIFGLGTIVTRSVPMESYAITGGQPPRILRRNVERDFSEG